MTAHELGAVLMIGYVTVGLIVLYSIAEGVVRWIRNGDSSACATCDDTGFVQPYGGLYWRCNACAGRTKSDVPA